MDDDPLPTPACAPGVRVMASRKVSRKKPAPPAPIAASPSPDDAKVRAKVRKVWGLYSNPDATDGEKAAVELRLREMAAEAGMECAAFLSAAGIPKPRIRVKAGSR